MSTIRKYHNHKPRTNPWHREEEPQNNHEIPGSQTKQSNQLSLPDQAGFKSRMDIKYCTTKHTTIKTPTTGVTINNKSTTTEPPPSYGQQHVKPPGDLNAFYWYQIFALDSAVVEVQKCSARMEAF